MRSSGAVKHRDQRGKLQRLPNTAFITGGAAVLFILILYILFFMAGSNADPSRPILLIYTRSEREVYVMEPAMTHSLKAAGFDHRLVRDKENKIPEDIKGRDVFIMGIGHDSWTLMRDINEDELGSANSGKNNIRGYIMLDPKYPGNLSMEHYDTVEPACDVAVFAFGKEAKDTSSMGDARRIFERMSGVDTVYGAYAKRGVLFGSRVYVSANQRRYLSLYGDMPYTMLLNSPSFQSELAGYLGTTYGNEVSFGSINAWFILLFAGVLFALASIFMFLFFVPVPERRAIKAEKTGDDGMAAIVNLGLAIWFGVIIVAGFIIPYTREYVRYVIFFAPLFMILVMVLMRLGFIFTNKIVYKTDHSGLPRTLAAALILTAFFTVMWLLVRSGNITCGTRKLIILCGVFLLDFILATALGYIDKKSRAGGENGCSYYANPLYLPELLIPAGTALVISFMGMGSTFTAVRGLMLVLIPYILSLPVKRISANVAAAGIVHAISFGLLLL